VQIVDAPIHEVAAWEMSKMSRANLKVHVKDGGLGRDMKKITVHNNILYNVHDLKIPTFLPRVFVWSGVWKWSDDRKELTVAFDDVEHEDYPEREDYLRVSGRYTMKFKQEAEVGGIPQTKVSYNQFVDLKGAVPPWVQNMQGVEFLMCVPTRRGFSLPPTTPP
jgi:hypothetical protein